MDYRGEADYITLSVCNISASTRVFQWDSANHMHRSDSKIATTPLKCSLDPANRLLILSEIYRASEQYIMLGPSSAFFWYIAFLAS